MKNYLVLNRNNELKFHFWGKKNEWFYYLKNRQNFFKIQQRYKGVIEKSSLKYLWKIKGKLIWMAEEKLQKMTLKNIDFLF
jgi:hypothetical protein